MNKKSFIKIVSFFLSIPCLANSDTLAMKQNQLHDQLGQINTQLDQVSGDLEAASKGILDFLENTQHGYVKRYLKDNTIEYVCKYGWLSDFKLADPKENSSRYIEFNSFLDEDNVMTLKINFYPKSGRVMVRKIVKPLAQIQGKNKNFDWPRNTQYNVSDYKISRTACFFNCYLVPKSKENIDLTQLFKKLSETIDNCNREVENVKKIYDLSKQYNVDFGSLSKSFNTARNLNLNFVYNQDIYNQYDNISIDNNLNIKKLNDHVTPLDKNIENTNVGINKLTFGSNNGLNNDDAINFIKNKNNSYFKNTKDNYIDPSNLTFKGNNNENDESHLSDFSDDHIRDLKINLFIDPNVIDPNDNVNIDFSNSTFKDNNNENNESYLSGYENLALNPSANNVTSDPNIDNNLILKNDSIINNNTIDEGQSESSWDYNNHPFEGLETLDGFASNTNNTI